MLVHCGKIFTTEGTEGTEENKNIRMSPTGIVPLW
jgi:hypothetical protein